MESILFTLLVLLAIFVKVNDSQRTTTETSTSTLTSTITVTSKFVCAKLVNVTGLCRRRRGLLIDEPVVLSFDDELDESIDDAFQHAVHPGKFMHTETLGVETTPSVVLPDRFAEHSEGFHRKNFNLPITMDVIESSVQISGRQTRAMMNDDDPQSRIYFSQLAAIASAILGAIRPPTITLTTTITVTRRSTTTKFKTNSFFVMGCTPSPLPFATCRAGKRNIENL